MKKLTVDGNAAVPGGSVIGVGGEELYRTRSNILKARARGPPNKSREARERMMPESLQTVMIQILLQ